MSNSHRTSTALKADMVTSETGNFPYFLLTRHRDAGKPSCFLNGTAVSAIKATSLFCQSLNPESLEQGLPRAPPPP